MKHEILRTNNQVSEYFPPNRSQSQLKIHLVRKPRTRQETQRNESQRRVERTTPPHVLVESNSGPPADRSARTLQSCRARINMTAGDGYPAVWWQSSTPYTTITPPWATSSTLWNRKRPLSSNRHRRFELRQYCDCSAHRLLTRWRKPRNKREQTIRVNCNRRTHANCTEGETTEKIWIKCDTVRAGR